MQTPVAAEAAVMVTAAKQTADNVRCIIAKELGGVC